jgi:magnesium-transporting ATPase (P-type)
MENQEFENFENQQQKLPNATAVLVLGIASLIGCCCYGVFGLLFGIVGIAISKKDMVLYSQNPNNFNNYKNLKIGRVLCIIGIILSVITILIFGFVIYVVGFDALQDPELSQQRLNDFFGV